MAFKMKGLGSLLGNRSESVKVQKSNLLGKNPVAKHASALYKYDGNSSSLHMKSMSPLYVQDSSGMDSGKLDDPKEGGKPPMTASEKIQGSAARKAYYKRHNMAMDDTTKSQSGNTESDEKGMTTATPEIEEEDKEVKAAKEKTEKQKASTDESKKQLTKAQELAKQEKKARQSKNKEARIKKRTARQTARSKRRTEKGGTRVGNFLRGAKSLVTKKDKS